MISLAAVVHVILLLIVGGIIFSLLFWLIDFCSSKFPYAAPFANVAKILLAVFAVLVIIGVLLSLVSGRSIFIP